MSFTDQFKQSLERSKKGFISHLKQVLAGGELGDDFYDELEEIFISGDIGVQTSLKLIDELKEEAIRLKFKERIQVQELLHRKLIDLLGSWQSMIITDQKPYVILLVGVNGSGKTTSAAKLANHFRKENKKVLLVAGDTFRAAAVEQLEIWAKRAGVDLIKQHSGSDPSALFFDALNSARAKKIDIVIGDTAGRLHNKYNLMEELNKIYRVIGRNMPGAPHQVLLVVDATTGQNAIAQAGSFNEVLPLTGLILTKLDGTARGGIVIGIQDVLKKPVCYIGTGEKIDDLAPFIAEDFVKALLN